MTGTEERHTQTPDHVDWLIVAASAISMATYFAMSLGVRGQMLFFIKAASQVLAKLGFHL